MKILTHAYSTFEEGESPMYAYVDITPEYAKSLLYLISVAAESKRDLGQRGYYFLDMRAFDDAVCWTSNISDKVLEALPDGFDKYEYEMAALPDDFDLDSTPGEENVDYDEDWADNKNHFRTECDTVVFDASGVFYKAVPKHADYHIVSGEISKSLLEEIAGGETK